MLNISGRNTRVIKILLKSYFVILSAPCNVMNEKIQDKTTKVIDTFILKVEVPHTRIE